VAIGGTQAPDNSVEEAFKSMKTRLHLIPNSVDSLSKRCGRRSHGFHCDSGDDIRLFRAQFRTNNALSREGADKLRAVNQRQALLSNTQRQTGR
jgi:hypothetical protein